jgi:hypothetical protein
MLRRLLVGLIATIAAGNGARAQINYEFQDPNTLTTITSINAVVGTPVQVNVIMRAISAATISQINTNLGFGSAGFRLEYDNPAGIANVANNAAVTLYTAGNGGPWDFGVVNTTDPSFTKVDLTSPFANGVALDANNAVRLARVTITPLANGSTTLRLRDSPVATGDTVSFATNGFGDPNVDYDSILQSVTLTFNVTPEPTTLLTFVGVAGLGCWARKRYVSRFR